MIQQGTEVPATRGAHRVVDWASVWSGALVGAGVMTMVSALWLALGYGSGVNTFHADIQWWLAATGIGSVFIGGYVAGGTARWGGPGRGITSSVVMWALVTIPAVFVAVLVAAAHHVTAGSTQGLLERVGNNSLWALFWATVIGLGAAVLGGVLGGATRGAVTHDDGVETHEGRWVYPDGTHEGARHARPDVSTARR